MNTTKRFVIMCIVISMVLCGFSFSVSAALGLEGDVYSSGYVPVCAKYPVSASLPYGENTLVIYYKNNNSFTHYWFFVDMGERVVSQNYYQDFIGRYSGYYMSHAGYNSTYDKLCLYSLSPIIQVQGVDNGNTWTLTSSVIGAVDDSFNVNGTNGQVRYKYVDDRFLTKTGRTIVSTRSMYYNGNTIDNLCDTFSSSWGSKSGYVSDYYIAPYPDALKDAIDSINHEFENTQGLIEGAYEGIQNTLDTMAGNIARMHNDIGVLQSKVNALSGQISQVNNNVSSAASANQSAVSSAAAENSSVVGQAASDIINAGDGSTINSDMSQVNGIVDKLNQWNSQLASFANGMDDSISGVANALDNGKALFEGFVGAAPVALSALIAFALIWFVVRKIIGR